MPGIVLCMLSKSAVEVLSFIVENGPVSPRDIAQRTELPIRTVFYAISNLIDENLVQWKPSLRDMRHKMYSLNRRRVEQLREIVEPLLVQGLFQIDEELHNILGITDIEVENSHSEVVGAKVSSA